MDKIMTILVRGFIHKKLVADVEVVETARGNGRGNEIQ